MVKMPELPTDILLTIVDELDVTEHEDCQTLRALLSVCRKIYSLLSRCLYQDISFTQGKYRMLALLARDAESNSSLKYTLTFSCVLRFRYRDQRILCDQTHRLLGDILPYLVNVRRITISLQSCFVDARILKSLPLSAPLSHLKIADCSLRSKDLQQLLASRPTLKWLHVYSHGIPPPSKPISLSANVLSSLLSLSVVDTETLFLKHPLPSLINLELTSTFVSVIHAMGTVRILTALFSSITSCRLTDIHPSNIAPFVTCLPHLKYLWVQADLVSSIYSRSLPPSVLMAFNRKKISITVFFLRRNCSIYDAVRGANHRTT